MNPNVTIGSKIKALRTAKQYTLKQVSEESGLSVGFLSQVERGISSVAIDSLAKIAACLEVSLSSFFENESVQDPDPIVHGFDQHFIQVSDQIIQATLSRNVMKYSFLPRIFQLLPFADFSDSDVEMYTHEGEEFLYVLEGVVTVFIDGRKYTLYPNDSIQINSTLPHNWVNGTNKSCKMLYLNFPNPFIANSAPEFMP